MMNPEIEIGLIFSTVHVYRKALRMYSILKGFELKFKKNDSNKVIAICRRKCGWKIYASYYRGTKAFQIKSIKGTPHRCPWSFKNMSANSRWLANNFSKELCDDPKWDLKGFKRTVKRRFKLHSSKYQIYRAKNHALAAIHGEHKEQFNRLRDYCATVMMKNPGSAAYVVSEVVALNANPIFKRMFIMFGAQKDGFVQGCRPVIGLDACHLKDKFGGHLMHAVGRDGNNQMYPLAMAWVESECKDSWSWFLETLTRHIGSPEDMHWAFISDRQKGLVETFANLFPRVEHRFCVRHMYANFKLRFKDKALRDIMWAAARAYLPAQWSRKMCELEAADVDAYNWLRAVPAHQWARSMFNPRSKCDLLSNNISESFNQYISSARDEPILTMFESIRKMIMCRYQEKRERIANVKSSICPRIHDKLEEKKLKSIDYEALPAGNVNSDKEAADYVHPYYSVHYYKLAYKHMIMPIPFREDWVETGEEPTEPPEIRRRPGRPRKVRRKGADEQRDATVVTRMGTVIHCRNCRQPGHNIKSCKQPRRSPATDQGEEPNQTSAENNGSTHPVQSQMESQITQSSTLSRGRGSHSMGGRPRNENIGFSNANPSSSRGMGIENTGSQSSKGKGINTRGGRPTTENISSTTFGGSVRRGRGRSNSERGRRGRGKGGVNSGPYSGIGNWNGIGMSSGTHFMPADKWSNNSTIGPQTTPSTAPTHASSSFQVQTEETTFGNVMFYSRPGRRGMHVQQQSKGPPN
ncbi:hypothetical protein ACH5RR_027664 [Cinchona calisaya]|uniref:Mutator-like transposase n=1 Tax=Cinchona calisaya TaxID=153742 RepID=A0ABD2YRV2_9GENT